MESRFQIAVKGATPAESQRLAQELAANLKFADPGVSVDREKDSAETLDLGATLAVVVGSAAVTALAKGIAAWLAKRQTAEISISKDGEVKAKGITSADALRLAEIMSRSN
jgi:Effector Associated Constant Component 1